MPNAPMLFGEFYGQGILAQLEPLQEELNALRNKSLHPVNKDYEEAKALIREVCGDT